MSLSIDQFFTKWNGRYLEYNNDIYKNQCMDEFYMYLKEVVGIDPRPFQGWGTAKNCYNNFANIKGASTIFDNIKNTPSNMPKRGDIVFWGTYLFVTGWTGHVAIYDKGDIYNLISFDQNYATGTPCHYQKHSYKGVLGWFHKK